MFTISTEPQFTHDISARVPVDGGYRTEDFKATFRVIDPDEIEQFDLSTGDDSTDFLKRVVVKLDDIGDAQGEPVEWSDEVLEKVLKLPWARGALARGYFAAIKGAASGN